MLDGSGVDTAAIAAVSCNCPSPVESYADPENVQSPAATVSTNTPR